jgi:hypothetical protein
MSIQSSIGLRNAILSTTSLKGATSGGLIKIYSNLLGDTLNPNNAPVGVLLATISINGGPTGLTLGDITADGIISKPIDIWKGVVTTSGIAYYWRWVIPGDTGSLTTTEIRMQGPVSNTVSGLILDTLTLTAGDVLLINSFNISLPLSI